jgi:hypothetical protein
MPKQPPHPPKAVQTQPGSPSDATGGRITDPTEAARYIAEFTAELSVVARGAKLELLAYLLDMARLEATRIQSGHGPEGRPPG